MEAITPAGSLRRGRETVGDLDLLVTGPSRTARWIASSRSRGWKKCWAAAKTRPAPRWAAKDCRWMCARCRRTPSARPCSTSPAARTTTWPFARAPSRWDSSSASTACSASRTKPGGGRDRSRMSTRRWACPGFRRNCARIAAKSKLPPKTACPNWSSCRRSAATSTCTPPRPTAAPRSKKWSAAARDRGYEYIAITDHSKALAMANGLDEARVVAFARQVREINRDGLGIRVFSGIECDILKDGAHGPGQRRPGRARPRDRQRPQPHEPGSRRDDRPPAARARMPAACASWAIPPAACCCSATPSRSISIASSSRPSGAACGWKSTPAPNGST